MNTFDVVTVTLNPALDRTLVIPGFRAGSVNRVESESVKAAGKGINVASALGGYGLRVAASGFLGSYNPEMFDSLFITREIADYLVRIPGATRTGIKILDPQQGLTTDINYPGIPVHPEHVSKLLGKIGSLQSKWFVLSGSLPPGLEPDFYRSLTQHLKAKGAKVAVDTSGEALKLALQAKPDFVKPNIHELEEIAGTTLSDTPSILYAARKLIADGVGLVAVSLGEHGAVFLDRNGFCKAAPPQVNVGSTVGAGDAMVAGAVASQIAELPLESAARLATAFSLGVLLSGMIRNREDVEVLGKRVVVSDGGSKR